MSGHADTIRRRLRGDPSSIGKGHPDALDALDALLAENQRTKRVARNSAKANADLRAENQRLRQALEQLKDVPGAAARVREALAGDEEPTEGYIIPEGDERCGYEIDACRCMRRKGHDGLHGCAHGDWGDRHARAPEDLIDDPAEALAEQAKD